MTNTSELLGKYRGALLGLAAGDALGTTLEFKPPSTFVRLTDMVGGGPFNLKAGQWTDDTSMALCLAESLVHCRGFDTKDQMERYVPWCQEGYLSCTGECFDIGVTVSRALSSYLDSGNPVAGSADPFRRADLAAFSIRGNVTITWPSFCQNFAATRSEIHLFCHRNGMLVSQVTVSFHRERSAIFMSKPAGDSGDVDSGFNGDGCV